MRILVFESNLMWSSRLSQSLRKLGHDPMLCSEMPADAEGAAAAIVNLGDARLEPTALVARLRGLGVAVIAHAGHKEKDLLELGRKANVEILATNSELTYKLAELLGRVEPS